MPADWDRLQNETTAAQLTFLETEVDTGITLAQIALKTGDRDKAERNLKSAQKAYETLTAHLDQLPAETPGLADVRDKMVKLRKLLQSVEHKQ